jgi:membrane protease YdiL (CAAX protease family)
MAPAGRFKTMDSVPELRVGTEPPLVTSGGRAAALLEILICSDYPTQIALAWIFAALGYGPLVGQPLSVRYVALLSLTDTVLLLALIAMFLSSRGERARDVFLGTRSPWREALTGLPLTFVALILGVMVLAGIQQLAPWLHTVEHNPLQDLIRTPRAAAVFAVVVVVAGGIREEVQRAFLLRRFEQWVGGAGVGVVVTSAAFGAGHLVQGADAAIATGLLGAFWAVIYLRRRSVAAPIVSHAGFNLLQLAQFLVFGR